MIPFPLQAGQLGLSQINNFVTFIGNSTITYVTATSQNVTVPTCLEGDLLVAVVMHRAVLTPPSADWILIDTINYTESAVLQYLSFYSKPAVASDSGASTTWTQASSGRMAAQLFVTRGDAGTPMALTTAKASSLTAVTNVPISVLSGTAASRQIAIVAATRVQGSTNNSLDAQYTMTSPTSVADNRMVTGYRNLVSGLTLSSNAVFDSAAGYETLSALIG